MDMKQLLQNEKERVNQLITRVMDSSRLERTRSDSEYLIDNWEEFKGQPIGGKLLLYEHGNPSFKEDHYFQTSVLDSFEIVELIPRIDARGNLTSFKYFGFWSPFWFLESGWQVNHAASFTKISEVKGGIKCIGTGDTQGQYDLLLSSIEVELNAAEAEMVREWNTFKAANEVRLTLARQQVRKEFVDSIIRKGWLK